MPGPRARGGRRGAAPPPSSPPRSGRACRRSRSGSRCGRDARGAGRAGRARHNGTVIAMRRWTVVMALLSVTLTACRDDTVRVTFRPAVGAVYRYEVTVRSHSEVRIAGEDPDIRDEEVVLQSEHTVLDAGPDGVRVRVILGD